MARDPLGDLATQRDWMVYRMMEAREVLDELPPDDRLTLVSLISEPGMTPERAIAMLRRVASMSAPERRRVVTLARSEDARDRALARTMAAQMPPLPDPRLALLKEARTAVSKAIRAFPNDPEAPALTNVVDDLGAIAAAIRARSPQA